MSIKINQLSIENVKRIKACKLEPTQNGLTVIGGKNGQGKTSTLDAIAWALGGERYRPSQANREGSLVPPEIYIELSNGLIVERKGKNSTLKVTDPRGNKSGQQLLNEFVEELSINLPRFMQASNSEKAETLLQIIGVGNQLKELEQKEKETYNERLAIGRIADQKEKYAREMPFHSDAPVDLISISDLIQQQQAILAQNGENQRLRNNVASLTDKKAQLSIQIEDLQSKLAQLQGEYDTVSHNLEIAHSSTQTLVDQSTAELEQSISNIEILNAKVRANLDRGKAEDDAKLNREAYSKLTVKIDDIRQQKTELLNGAQLPLSGLSVADGELTYNGKKWDCMSGADQLRVSTAIVRAINPNCGFVLLDKLEQMDTETLQEFGAWLETEGLQAIATRVSTGDECSIIIEDGYSSNLEDAPQPQMKKWEAGEF